jgi:putative membrane protein
MTFRRSPRWILRELVETLKIGWAGLALVLINRSLLLFFLAYLVLVVLLKAWAWWRTTIEVGGDAVVLEIRGLSTKRESVARSAIETLVVSAEMLDRLCGLQTLQLTTNDDSNTLVLKGLSSQSVRGISASLETEVSEEASNARLIAAFKPGWFGYALLTPIGWTGVVGVVFLANRIGDRFVSPFDGLSAQAQAALDQVATPLLIVLSVAAGVAIVLLPYAVRYGRFRLEESVGKNGAEDPLLV